MLFFPRLDRELHILVLTYTVYHLFIIKLDYDAQINIVDLENNSKNVVSLGELPMLQVKFIFENLIIATGHSYSPTIIGVDKSSGKW